MGVKGQFDSGMDITSEVTLPNAGLRPHQPGALPRALHLQWKGCIGRIPALAFRM